MLKSKENKTWICNQCSKKFHKWEGCCPICKSWNSIMEANCNNIQSSICFIEEVKNIESKTIDTGFSEVNRVLGNGIVTGSFTLLGGEPGIGKSTLIMQICSNCCNNGNSVLYFSGEESIQQISTRAKRISNNCNKILCSNEMNIENISAIIKQSQYDLVIIDSIQTVYDSSIQYSPYSTAQLKNTCNQLLIISKNTSTSIMIIGHVTKDGDIAGPKMIEHMVDTVMYIEGDKKSNLRIIRAIKNRFGPTDEVGVIEMTSKGFKETKSLSQQFILDSNYNYPGSVCTVFTEGTRAFVTQVQALASKSYFATPARRSIGFDPNRMSLLIAILQKHTTVPLYQFDIFFSSIGGLKITDTACDVALILALFSSINNKIVDHSTVAFGEIGLSGEIRPISSLSTRIKEAKSMGYTTCIIPKQNTLDKSFDCLGMNIMPFGNICDILKMSNN